MSNQNQSLVKREIGHYFIRLMISFTQKQIGPVSLISMVSCTVTNPSPKLYKPATYADSRKLFASTVLFRNINIIKAYKLFL